MIILFYLSLFQLLPISTDANSWSCCAGLLWSTTCLKTFPCGAPTRSAATLWSPLPRPLPRPLYTTHCRTLQQAQARTLQGPWRSIMKRWFLLLILSANSEGKVSKKFIVSLDFKFYLAMEIIAVSQKMLYGFYFTSYFRALQVASCWMQKNWDFLLNLDWRRFSIHIILRVSNIKVLKCRLLIQFLK